MQINSLSSKTKYASNFDLMYACDVRTTVNIDTDVYNFASAFARGKGITLSAAISELLRRVERLSEPDSGRLEMNEYGYLEIVGGGRITPEMVKEASEDELV